MTEKEILKPTKASKVMMILFRFSVLDEIYCDCSVFGDFLRGFFAF